MKWYKDGAELKPGDIHRIISGQDGTCCLGTYTCEATNCMGTVSSSASLLGFEDRVTTSTGAVDSSLPFSALDHDRELARNLSLSTIHEERTSQLHDTPQTDHSVTLDDRGEVSFSFDGKEVSVSLYETPDLTEEEAIQIVEMYADQLSEHVTEHNVIELPPMRFMKETSTSGNLLMEAVVIDVSPDYFVTVEEGDDLRTEADVEDMSILDDQANHTLSLSSPLPHESQVEISLMEEDRPPIKPPRRKSGSMASKSERSEKSDKKLQESESYHSAKEPLNGAVSPQKKDDLDMDIDLDSEAFADALSSARSRAESNLVELQKDDFNGDKNGSSLEVGDSSFDSAVTSGAIKKRSTRKKRSLGEKGSSEDSAKEERKRIRRSESAESGVPMKIDKSQTDDESEKSSLMSNKDVLLNISRQLLEPVLIIRDALVDFNSLLSLAERSDEEQDAFISENFVLPLQNLCEQLSVIEVKALKNTGKRSLIQNARIAILEAIGGPTEELLRGIEIMKRRGNSDVLKTDPVILEPLVDPVEEILTGLSKIEYELSGTSRVEKPIILERMIRTISWLGRHVEGADPSSVMIKSLTAIYKTLDSFVNKITLNPLNGTWTENMDAVLVESLCRPLEDLAQTSSGILNDDTPMNPEVAKQLSEPFEELLTRLDTLVVALEGYETDHRNEFVLALKSSLVEAAEELTRFSEETMALEEARSLPDVILDPLIDVQSSINSTLRIIEEPRSEEEIKISQVLRSSELAISLSELRQALSTAAHTATTLKEEETVEALTDLREPLFDLQLALSSECLLEEIPIINSIISPLNAVKIIFSTTLRYVHGTELANSISPILQMLEEMQQQIPMVVEQLTLIESQTPKISSEKEEPDRRKALTEILESLEVANQMSTVFFDLSSVLEEQERNFGRSALSGSRFVSRLEEVRESIGSATVSLGNLPIKISLNDDDIINELAHLSAPLINLQKELNAKLNVLEKKILNGVATPIGKLKIVIESLAESIYKPEKVMLVLGLLGDVEESMKELDSQAYDSEVQVETVDELQTEALQMSEQAILDRAIQRDVESELISEKSSEIPQVLSMASLKENVELEEVEECNKVKDERSLKKFSLDESSEQKGATRTSATEESVDVLKMADSKKGFEFEIMREDQTDNQKLVELREAHEREDLSSTENFQISESPNILQMAKTEEVTDFEEAEINTDLIRKDNFQLIDEIASITDEAKVTDSPNVLKIGRPDEAEKFESAESLEIDKTKDSQVPLQKSSEEENRTMAELINQPKVLNMAQIEESTILPLKADKMEVVKDDQEIIQLQDHHEKEGISTVKAQILEGPKVLQMAEAEEAMDFEEVEENTKKIVKDHLQEKCETTSPTDTAKVIESLDVLKIGNLNEADKFESTETLETEKNKDTQVLLQKDLEEETKSMAKLINQPEVLKMAQDEETAKLDEKAVILEKGDKIELIKDSQEVIEDLLGVERAQVSKAPKVLQMTKTEEAMDFKEAEINKDLNTKENLLEIHETLPTNEKAKVTESSNVLKIGKHDEAEKFEIAESLETEKIEGTQVLLQQSSDEEAKTMAGLTNQPEVLRMAQVEETIKLDEATIVPGNIDEVKVNEVVQEIVAEAVGTSEAPGVMRIGGANETAESEETNTFAENKPEIQEINEKVINSSLNKEILDISEMPQVLQSALVSEAEIIGNETEFQKLEDNKIRDVFQVEEKQEVSNLDSSVKTETPEIYKMAVTDTTLELQEEVTEVGGIDQNIDQLKELEETKNVETVQVTEKPKVLNMGEVGESVGLSDSTVDLDELEIDKNISKVNLQEGNEVLESNESGKIEITGQKVLKMGNVKETSLIEEVAGTKESSVSKESAKEVLDASEILQAAEQIENFDDSMVETLKETKDIMNLKLQESEELTKTESATLVDVPQVLQKEDAKEVAEMDQLTEFMNEALTKKESGNVKDVSSMEGTVNVSNAPVVLRTGEAEDVSTLSEAVLGMDSENIDKVSLHEIIGKSETDESDKILKISEPPDVLKMAKAEESTSYEETSTEGLVLSEPLETDVSIEQCSELLRVAKSGEEMEIEEIVGEVAEGTERITLNIEISEEGVQAETAKVVEKPKVLALAEAEDMRVEESIAETETFEKGKSRIKSNLQEVMESVEMGTVNISNAPNVLKMGEAEEPMDLDETTTEIGEIKDDFKINEPKSAVVDQTGEKAVGKIELAEVKTLEEKVVNEAENKEEKVQVQKQLLTKLAHALEGVKQQITNIVEEFEQRAVTTPVLPVSQLAAAIEMLRRSVLHVQSNVSKHSLQVSDSSVESFLAETSCDTETLIADLMELLDPLIKVGEALSVTQEYRAPELQLLNRLNEPIQAIKQNVVNLVMESSAQELEDSASYVASSLEPMVQALKTIENEIPLALSEVNSRQEIVNVLHNVLRPLEVVRERMNELDISAERTLETDVANILVGPTNYFSRILGDLLKQFEVSDQSEERIRDAVLNLHRLVEPLFEFHSSLCVVRSSRRSSVIETALLEERKNVILRSVEGLKSALTEIIETVGIKHEDDEKDVAETLLDSLITLNAAMSSVQRHVW